MNPVLAEYVERQETTFGEEEVWSYRARNHLGFHFARPGLRAFFLALFLTGVAWALTMLGGRPYHPWGAVGIPLAVATALFSLIIWLVGEPAPGRLRKWRQSSLVICPDGLALVQDDLKGELRWGEVLDVRVRSKVRGLRFSAADATPGIHLKVQGARIVIVNVYDRPLLLIYDRIREYWR